MGRLIAQNKTVIPACDVATLQKLSEIARGVQGVPGIEAVKVGLELVIPHGLARVVEVVKEASPFLKVIYDHQKGGTDIPELGTKFAKAVRSTGVDAVILFPFGGAATLEKWLVACQEEGLTVLVGGHMTQPKFLEDEGGFIANSGPESIYRLSAGAKVTDFVVPGNKVNFVRRYREFLEAILGIGNFTLYAPGFVGQGGIISETGAAAGYNWHAIVGGAIYNADGIEGIRAAALAMTSQIGT